MIQDIADKRITPVEHVTPYFTFQMTFTGHKKHMSSGDRNVKVLVIDHYEKRLNAFDQTG